MREESAERRGDGVVGPRFRQSPGFRVARRDGFDPRQRLQQGQVRRVRLRVRGVAGRENVEHAPERVDGLFQAFARPRESVDAVERADVGERRRLAELYSDIQATAAFAFTTCFAFAFAFVFAVFIAACFFEAAFIVYRESSLAPAPHRYSPGC